MSNKVLGPVVATAVALLGACGGGEPSVPVTFPPVQPATVTKLLVFVVENHSLDQMRAANALHGSLVQGFRECDGLPGGDAPVAAQLPGDDRRQHVRRR